MRYAHVLAELKRRKVFRVTAVYGATAFVILQLADIVFPPLGLPQWTLTLVVVLAIIGFPMAVAMAWTFESTPDGLRRTESADGAALDALLAQPRSRRWPAGIAALAGTALLIAGIAWTLDIRGGGRSANYDSIAVLPFVNLSGDPQNEYFGDGLAEELLNALAGLEGVKVAARTSAFAFKGSNIGIRAIGDTLAVATVLEGSVRRSADRVRITAQLIDARTGYHLWSESYDRPLTDLFSVQDAIAAEIVSALAGRLATSQKEWYRGGTTDVLAYDAYLLGRQKWTGRQVPQLREAIAHFEHAIARDSGFALAWSGLADAIDALAWRVPSERRQLPAAKYAAQRALALDPQLAEAWASAGVLALDFDRDFRMAELALRRAIALKPSYAAPHNWLADALRFSGRVEESLEPSRRGLELDPVSGLGMNGILQTFANLNRWDEARAVVDRLRSIDYNTGTIVNILSGAAQLKLSADELAAFAVEWATLSGYSNPAEASVLGRAMVDPRARPQAREVLRRMNEEAISAPQLAELAVAVGDHDAALTYLARAVASGDPTIIVIGTDWAFDPLRQDPRFAALLQQLGLPNGR